MAAPTNPRLILASSSPYRRDLLTRLNIPFSTCSPDVDESVKPGETPIAVARRLALQKARAVAQKRPGAIIIGADQVLDFHGQALGKPGSRDKARMQLAMLSGKRVTFQTAMALVTPTSTRIRVSACVANFRQLSEAQIEYYLNIEQPYDTAGSAKAESLGIALLESLESEDPTAIIGLPLIELTRLLSLAGLDPLNPKNRSD